MYQILSSFLQQTALSKFAQQGYGWKDFRFNKTALSVKYFTEKSSVWQEQEFC